MLPGENPQDQGHQISTPCDSSAVSEETRKAVSYVNIRLMLYRIYNNPYHLWDLYTICRGYGLNLPNAFWRYLDDSAERLVDHKSINADDITSDLGLGARGGGASKARQMQTQERVFRIVYRVQWYKNLRESGAFEGSFQHIYAKAGDELGISAKVVKTEYNSFRRSAKRMGLWREDA